MQQLCEKQPLLFACLCPEPTSYRNASSVGAGTCPVTEPTKPSGHWAQPELGLQIPSQLTQAAGLTRIQHSWDITQLAQPAALCHPCIPSQRTEGIWPLTGTLDRRAGGSIRADFTVRAA